MKRLRRLRLDRRSLSVGLAGGVIVAGGWMAAGSAAATVEELAQAQTTRPRAQVVGPNLRLRFQQLDDLSEDQPTRYQLDLDNIGQVAANDVILRVPLPDSVNAGSATSATASCTLGDDTLVCRVPTIAAGREGLDTVTLTLAARPGTQGQNIVLRATASARQEDVNVLDNVAIVEGLVTGAGAAPSSSTAPVTSELPPAQSLPGSSTTSTAATPSTTTTTTTAAAVPTSALAANPATTAPAPGLVGGPTSPSTARDGLADTGPADGARAVVGAALIAAGFALVVLGRRGLPSSTR